MKYENFREIQNSMRAVTINSEFSLPGLTWRNSRYYSHLQFNNCHCWDNNCVLAKRVAPFTSGDKGDGNLQLV